MSEETEQPKSVWREIGYGLGSIIIVALAFGFYVSLMQWGFETHWLIGASLIVFYAYTLTVGLQDLLAPESKFFPVRKGLTIFVLVMLIGVTTFAAVSFLLALVHVAQYSGQASPDLIDFHAYYFWVFFDMLPGLEITETYNWEATLQSENFWAGLPVIGFRGFVIYGLLRSLKTWWEKRSEDDSKDE